MRNEPKFNLGQPVQFSQSPETMGRVVGLSPHNESWLYAIYDGYEKVEIVDVAESLLAPLRCADIGMRQCLEVVA